MHRKRASISNARIERLRAHCKNALDHCLNLDEYERNLLRGFLSSTRKPHSQPYVDTLAKVRRFMISPGRFEVLDDAQP